jgi:hypothetical protein
VAAAASTLATLAVESGDRVDKGRVLQSGGNGAELECAMRGKRFDEDDTDGFNRSRRDENRKGVRHGQAQHGRGGVGVWHRHDVGTEEAGGDRRSATARDRGGALGGGVRYGENWWCLGRLESTATFPNYFEYFQKRLELIRSMMLFLY